MLSLIQLYSVESGMSRGAFQKPNWDDASHALGNEAEAPAPCVKMHFSILSLDSSQID